METIRILSTAVNILIDCIDENKIPSKYKGLKNHWNSTLSQKECGFLTKKSADVKIAQYKKIMDFLKYSLTKEK